MEDPVEDCSDGEAPALPAPRTPPGVGRFATIVGAQFSGDGKEGEEGEEGEEVSADAARDGPGLTQELEGMLSSAQANLEDLLDAADVEDTVPGDLEAFLDAPRLQDDGTMAVPGLGGEEEQAPFDRLADEMASESEGEAPGGAGEGFEEPLPDEPWSSWPQREREMWERVRPRHVRREAQKLQRLRLPIAGISRLMRLHPALQTKSSEALEVINVSTVLLLQAVVRQAARGKSNGQRVQFEDIRSACLNVKELQFMHPVSSSLDASALVLRNGAEAAPEDGVKAANQPKVSSRRGQTSVAAPGQSLLQASIFAENSKGAGIEVEDQDTDADSGGEQTPEQSKVRSDQGGDAAKGSKRKAPESSKKLPTKAQRRTPGNKKPEVPVGPGFAGLFRRADTAAGA
eukprot:CAMPEP_0115076368 /NCGR_PEP_ID=MMETSP0227-20121206/16391_1 /TAXON_ID=89957 /ORGANISM="Polarella glacialis, Strain CCMP 1383" /LENGTH=401 /DNA_ID=CAMNT_0002463507 /DNA_START=96 /DNA_END=1301 /DNA_ORIENTATION=+